VWKSVECGARGDSEAPERQDWYLLLVHFAALGCPRSRGGGLAVRLDPDYSGSVVLNFFRTLVLFGEYFCRLVGESSLASCRNYYEFPGCLKIASSYFASWFSSDISFTVSGHSTVYSYYRDQIG